MSVPGLQSTIPNKPFTITVEEVVVSAWDKGKITGKSRYSFNVDWTGDRMAVRNIVCVSHETLSNPWPEVDVVTLETALREVAAQYRRSWHVHYEAEIGARTHWIEDIAMRKAVVSHRLPRVLLEGPPSAIDAFKTSFKAGS